MEKRGVEASADDGAIFFRIIPRAIFPHRIVIDPAVHLRTRRNLAIAWKKLPWKKSQEIASREHDDGERERGHSLHISQLFFMVLEPVLCPRKLQIGSSGSSRAARSRLIRRICFQSRRIILPLRRGNLCTHARRVTRRMPIAYNNREYCADVSLLKNLTFANKFS